METLLVLIAIVFGWLWWERKKQAERSAKMIFFQTLKSHFDKDGIEISPCFGEGRWWTATLYGKKLSFECFSSFEEQKRNFPSESSKNRWTSGSILTEDYCASGGYGADFAIMQINKDLLQKQ